LSKIVAGLSLISGWYLKIRVLIGEDLSGFTRIVSELRFQFR
jgi:hypothetical protein